MNWKGEAEKLSDCALQHWLAFPGLMNWSGEAINHLLLGAGPGLAVIC